MSNVFFDHWELYERTQCYPLLAAGAAAARVLDQREGTGERLALVRDLFDHRAMPVRIRTFWEPVIIAELMTRQTRGGPRWISWRSSRRLRTCIRMQVCDSASTWSRRVSVSRPSKCSLLRRSGR